MGKIKNRAFDHSKYRDWINPQDVTPYPMNAKQHNDRQIKNIVNSIRRFGWQQDVVITSDNVLVIGHGRRLAALKLGCEMPYHVIDKTADELTDEDIRELRIADNQTNAETGMDFDMLNIEIEDLDFDGFDFDFGDAEIGGGVTEADIIEDEAPEIQEATVAKRGDIWQLGMHRLMCGDSTVIDDVEKLMDGESADLLITDPPYNVDYEGGTKEKLKIINDKQGDAQFLHFLTDAFTTANMVMKPGAVFYIWHADSEGLNFRQACKDAGWTVRQCLIWNKNSMVMGRQDYQWKHEPCLYGWKDGAGHLWASDRKQVTVIDYAKPQRNDIHPTMKPVGLFDYQIKNNTKGGDIVLDLFGGSGTTIMACEQDGRRGYVMELDPRYVDAIIKRWENFTGEKAVLINDAA